MAQNFQPLGVLRVERLEAPFADAFHQVLRDSIADGMNRILGAEGTQAILYHLDLPSFDDPKKFHDRLTEIFGFGTASLERVIIQQLHRATGVSSALARDGDFVGQVALAQQSFHAKEGRRMGATA
ncbi:MAG: DUF3227 domain-containing protein [Thaumarchaeota archaeon]|nr:DUF3227 domain-containing protein [Nitrososphaerota archaeon]